MYIHIIGAGIMGSAIAQKLANTHKVFVYDRKRKKIPGTAFDFGLKNIFRSDYIIIAVKPQDMPALALQIRALIKPSTVLVSIVAGVKIAKIQSLFAHKKMVRMMPNLGLSVGEGIAGWKAMGLSLQEKRRARKLLNTLTQNFEVKNEFELDSITAISGSGPAYFFYLADCLRKSAMHLGLSASQSKRLVEKTFSASARLQAQGDYQSLINRVRSKKGTTDAALKVFEKKRLSEIINSAVKAAQKRAKELSNA